DLCDVTENLPHPFGEILLPCSLLWRIPKSSLSDPRHFQAQIQTTCFRVKIN
ncbi:hypothetical protein AMECASPLE_035918, partial [Ameca splendens]